VAPPHFIPGVAPQLRLLAQLFPPPHLRENICTVLSYVVDIEVLLGLGWQARGGLSFKAFQDLLPRSGAQGSNDSNLLFVFKFTKLEQHLCIFAHSHNIRVQWLVVRLSLE